MWHDAENDLSKAPITAMGFFSHEALDVDPRTGIVYLAKDDFRGAIPADPNAEIDGDPAFRSSFLYRYLPNDGRPRPGALLAGGTLQALAIDSAPRNADLYNPGQTFAVRWITVDPAEPPRRRAREKRCVSRGSRAATSPAAPSGSTTPPAARRDEARCTA
jgi:uncharacterized protein